MSDIKRNQSEIWSTHAGYQDYDTNPIHKKRSLWFVDYIGRYDFSSVLEVGSCTGRNLEYISKQFPDVKLNGIDVNPQAVTYAKDKRLNAKFDIKDIYDMEEDEKWDLVFTMAVLIHIHPDGILGVIKKLTNIANKYIIHIERNGDGSIITGPKELNPECCQDKLHWRPNIDEMYKSLGFKNVIVSEVPEEFNHSGASHMVVVDLFGGKK